MQESINSVRGNADVRSLTAKKDGKDQAVARTFMRCCLSCGIRLFALVFVLVAVLGEGE
jgi:hypothetical protein